MDRPQLFVSHHSSKADIARQIVGELERRGVRCWLAPRDIEPGQAFDRAIADAIGQVDAILVLFCEEADASRHVRRELIMADEAGKAILPLRLDRVAPDELAYWFKDAQWIDWLDGRSGALDRIARQVQALTAARIAHETSPAATPVAADMAAMGGVPLATAEAIAAPPPQPVPPPPASLAKGAPWHVLAVSWWVIAYSILNLPVLLYYAVEPANYISPGSPAPPGWAGATALVVGVALLGAGVLLLFRNRLATAAFGLSLVLSVLQHLAMFVFAGPTVVTGNVLVIGFTGWMFLIGFTAYSWQMAKRGVLR